MYFIILLLASSVTCFVNRGLNKLEFKGFIYPYAVYILTSNSSKILLFQTLATGQVIPLTQKDKNYLEKYDHLKSFIFPPANLNPAEISIKQNMFIVKSISNEVSWSITYLKRPHLHKFFTTQNMSRNLQEYVSFFNKKQQMIKWNKMYLFDACQLWRNWVFASLQVHNQSFYVFLRRQPGHEMNKKYAFIKDYFSIGNITKIVLQKHSSTLALQFLIISQKQICLFYVDQNLDMNFKHCSIKQNNIVDILSLTSSKIAILYSPKSFTPVFKFEIQSIENNISHCSVILPFPKIGQYFINKMIHNRLVFCATEECHSYSFNCEQIQAIQQKIQRITNIFYERIQHDYLQFVFSTVVIETAVETLVFSECDRPELKMQNTLCLKEKSKNYQWINDKYSSLNCYNCARTPQCYFQDEICFYNPHKEIQLFHNSVYQNKEMFIEQYAKYEAGITSTCNNKQLKCTLQIQGYHSYINIEQNDEVSVESTCQVLVPLNTTSAFLIQFPQQSKFDLQLCSSQSGETPFTCLLTNVPIKQITGFSLNAMTYILFIFVAKSGGPNWNQFIMTDMNEQNLHRATLIFSEIVIGFVFITIVLVLYAILKNRILTRLALWGWIPFRLSGKYPLNNVQLELKIKYYTNQRFIKQVHNLQLESTKQPKQQCCFCLSDLNSESELFQIFCRHQFHKVCLSQWFQLQPTSDKCPMCKRLFLLEQVEKFNQVDHEFHRKTSTSSLLSKSAISEDVINE